MLQRALIMLLLCGAMHALQLTLQRSSISSQRLLKRKTLLRMGIEDNYSRIPFNELLEGVQSIPSVSNTRHTPQLLRNRYVGLRHGQSKANVQGIISSNPAIGTVEHNLTDMGIQQANEAALDLLEDLKESNDSTDPFNNVVVISSDFTRAKETAEHCMNKVQQIIRTSYPSAVTSNFPITIRTELRERYFGDYDAKELIFYNRVWPIDNVDADNNRFGVESVNAVINRSIRLIEDLEAQYEDKILVLVSHADTLQIMQAYLAGLDARMFHQYRFKNGEVRPFLSVPAPASIEYN